MVIQEYMSGEGSVCEYKNCKQEVDFIQMLEDTEKAYYEGKLRCKNHQAK